MTSLSPTSTIPAAPIESLIAGRTRRSNAGNLLAKLLTQEADSEDTLFLEDEDDVEFEVKEKDDPSDVALDSSSDDDDDQGPPPAGKEEQLDGEQEIERAEKEERRRRKRKTDDAFMKPRARGRVTVGARPGAVKKKVMIVEAEAEAAAAEAAEAAAGAAVPTKAAARKASIASEFVATRASSRTLSLQNRSDTLRRLEESEKRRLHTIALMEAAAKKKSKTKPRKEPTQEERLAEARVTERRNKKSLNSWEEMEAAKLEEQRLKLAALQNRKLAGPVVTYWSGRAEWGWKTALDGDRVGVLLKVGKGRMVEEVEEEEEEVVEEVEEDVLRRKKKKLKVAEGGEEEEEEKEKTEGESRTTPSLDPPFSPRIAPAIAPPAPAPAPAPDPTPTATTPAPPPPPPPPIPSDTIHVIPPSTATASTTTITTTTATTTATTTTTTTTPSADPLLPPPEIAARTLIVLENFSLDQVRDRASVVRTLWGPDQFKRPATVKPHCVITHQPAKFCDPATGMPYASLFAYREIRRILKGDIRWSGLLGVYTGERWGEGVPGGVGIDGGPAKGVPEGF